ELMSLLCHKRSTRINKAANNCEGMMMPPATPAEKDLMKELARFSEVIDSAYNELAPHKICAYIYTLSDTFNVFYNKVRILSEESLIRRNSYLSLLKLTKDILEECIWLLGFEAPERM
ncbi:MAG: hypothetical protein HUJ75_00875, partial [Parasporobacterium sp.]|nr:hypothetical protein [Parasporobacterium sp.]